MEKVVLVNEKDDQINTLEKLEAHRQGLLHRAFSVIIFNEKGQMLLQKRAIGKYHSGGLWSNTCCSHPRPNKNLQHEAERRLVEEMGIRCTLRWRFSFQYKVSFENGLIENEFDHVFVGKCNDQPVYNKEEVSDWKYIDLDELVADMDTNPKKYTHWFHIIMSKLSNTDNHNP